MKNKDLRRRILSESDSFVVPDVLDKARQYPINTKAEPTRRRKFKLIPVLSLVVLLIAVIIPLQVYIFSFDDTAVAMVSIDINPSVELYVNKEGKVVEAKGINEDGVELLNYNSLRRKSLDKAIDIVMTKVHKKGIENTTVLVNVDSENAIYKGKFKTATENQIRGYYNRNNKQGNIIWADAPDNNSPVNEQNINQQAKYYGISQAKLRLIYQIIEEHPEYTVEELAGKSIGELNQIRSGRGN